MKLSVGLCPYCNATLAVQFDLQTHEVMGGVGGLDLYLADPSLELLKPPGLSPEADKAMKAWAKKDGRGWRKAAK